MMFLRACRKPSLSVSFQRRLSNISFSLEQEKLLYFILYKQILVNLFFRGNC